MAIYQAARVRYEPRREIAAADIGTTYAIVGMTGFENPIRELKFHNNTDADLDISFDGIIDHDFAAMKSGAVSDYCSNKSEQAGALEQPSGTRVYVKYTSAAPTTGSFYVVAIYASPN